MPRKAFTKLLIDMLHERCVPVPPRCLHHTSCTRSTDIMVELQHTPTSVDLLDHAVAVPYVEDAAPPSGPGSGTVDDPWHREEDVPQVPRWCWQ